MHTHPKADPITAKTIIFVVILLIASFFLIKSSMNKVGNLEYESDDKGNYSLGRVMDIVSESEGGDYEGLISYDGVTAYDQVVTVKIDNGETIDIPFTANESDLKLTKGTRIILREQELMDDKTEIVIVDTYRTPQIIIMFVVFMLLIVLVAGINGVTSLVGLVYSIVILVFYVVPEIINGASPLYISLVASVLIGAVSIYFSHGFNKRATISLIGILITIFLTILISVFFVGYSSMSGQSSDEATFLKSIFGHINLRELFIGGIILGTLGVLDDVTTAQVAAVEELKSANKSFGFKELYKRASVVGKEHILSLVNTLVIAYIGASLPLLFLFVINTAQPVWVIFNNEFIIEEVVRSLIGSMALVFAVPVTTLIAAWSYKD